MPKINAEESQPVSFRVPAPLLKDAEELAELEGWTLAKFNFACWESGLAVLAERSNKRLVNRGLRAKQTKLTVVAEAHNTGEYVTADELKADLQRKSAPKSKGANEPLS